MDTLSLSLWPMMDNAEREATSVTKTRSLNLLFASSSCAWPNGSSGIIGLDSLCVPSRSVVTTDHVSYTAYLFAAWLACVEQPSADLLWSRNKRGIKPHQRVDLFSEPENRLKRMM
jgi:hypothetical protein